MDSSLALYPLPDLIVVGDPSKPFEIQHHGCTVVNTVRCFHKIFAFTYINNAFLKEIEFINTFNFFQGSFPKSKFTFKVYVPSSRIIEDSQIPDDD